MKASFARSCALVAVSMGVAQHDVFAQVVRVAPIIKLSPTADADARLPGTVPPPSAGLVPQDTIFYIELWATNNDKPLNGLACVYVDLQYDRTDLVDAVVPVEDSPLFPINAVPVVFDDPSGTVGDIGGCQPAPPIDLLGVDEWVFVERIQMDAVGAGGPIVVSLQDADNIFAFTAIIGDASGVPPSEIEFQSRTFTIGCSVDDDCDDGNPCTTDSCDSVSGACVNDPLLAGTGMCTDNDQCTSFDGTPSDDDACDGMGGCLGTPVDCDDDNPCTVDDCDSMSGCVHTSIDCEDGDVCTINECINGSCEIVGTLNCDDGNVCTDDTCDPAGGCINNPNNESCSDGDACTVGDVCSGGACQAGEPLSCDDGNACTDDACNPVVGCTNTPNTNPCDDGDACTVGDLCADGGCQSGEPLNCSDGDPCTVDSCESPGGCINTPIDCEDGDTCTLNKCVDGRCLVVDVQDCDDGNPCTDDVCDSENGCVNTPNSEPCDDGDSCTVGDMCSGGVCQSGASIDCDDGNVCTDDRCDSLGGCINTPNSAPCDDGDSCTAPDMCLAGVCQSGEPIVCDDGNACTDDTCDALEGCVHSPNNDSCDDGDPCTVGEMCTGGVCQGGEPVECDDGDSCTIDSCDPVFGCINTEIDCEDGNQCTINMCILGECQIVGNLDCDDGNECTDDACDSVSGCGNLPNNNSCDDGDSCTQDDSCFGGMCSGTPIECPPGELCEEGICVPGDIVDGALDIKPGGCPNPLNRKSKGKLPVALLGTSTIDVSQVVLSSLRLTREGVSGWATPIEGPPGPHSVIEDVATPFEGELCNCHELDGDGVSDLSMKFNTPEVVEALELDDLPAGTLVELELRGELLNGSMFSAYDCIWLVGSD